jgi:hypothetical protein
MPRISTPSAEFPEMTLRAAVVVPPMTLLVASRISTPRGLTEGPPPRSKPRSLPTIVLKLDWIEMSPPRKPNTSSPLIVLTSDPDPRNNPEASGPAPAPSRRTIG